MTVRVGLVGYGYWGTNLARNVAELPAFELVAVADERPARREVIARRFSRAEAVESADALLARPDLDAVILATPVSSHYPLARQAIERGLHVLVEKPLAGSVAEAEQLVELAERAGVRLMVDHTFVYTGAVRRIKEIVDSGSLGEVLYLDSVRINLGVFQHDTNVIWDLAPHDFSILDYVIARRPVAVSTTASRLSGYEQEDVAYVAVHFEDAFLAHFHVNWVSPVKIRRILIGGRQRMLEYDDMDPSEKVRVYDRGVDIDVSDDEQLRRVLFSYRMGDVFAPTLDRREALAVMLEEFAASIEVRRAPLTDGAAGCRVVRLLEAADRSLREGGRRVSL